MTAPARSPRRRVTPWLLLGLVLASGIGVGAYRWFRAPASPDHLTSPPADPRLAYNGPFRNIHPDVHSVGDAACAGCHSDECEKFHQHPMGRSIRTMADWMATRKKEPAQSLERLKSRLIVEPDGPHVWHKQECLDKDGQVVATNKSQVDFVIGSGNRGHSFFTTREGFLFQTPISWFTQKGIWDVSPGFSNFRLRPVPARCLFCHSGGATPVKTSGHRYEEPIFVSPSITCERCHGPASLHVEERNRNMKVKLPDYTIVNPKHLSPELREDVCHQCHLSGEVKILRRGRDTFDFRPGLSLPDFWSVYVATADVPVKQRAVGQVEQLAESKCFKKSNGQMGCATCHDPHEQLLPEKRVAHHRQKCLECHETQHPCSLDRAERLKTSKMDNCMTCHMKRLHELDIAHTAVTNHRIERVPQEQPHADFSMQPTIHLELFHKDRRGEEDADRDLGMALVREAQKKHALAVLPRAQVLLERARKRMPDDVPLLEELSQCLMLMNLQARALEVLEHILTLEPGNPQALLSAGQLHYHLGQFDRAVSYLEKAHAQEPYYGVVSSNLVLALLKKKDYGRAAEVCQAWLEFEADNGDTWAILAHCQRKLGKPDAAAQRKADRLGASRYEE